MATTILWIASAYFGIGLLFAIYFAVWGAQRLDSAAADAPWGFRLLIVPGATALWPVLLPRVFRRQAGEHAQ